MIPGGGILRAYCSIALLFLIFIIFLWSINESIGTSRLWPLDFSLYSSIPAFLLFILALINLKTEIGWTLRLSKAILILLLIATVIINTLAMIFPDILLAGTKVGIYSIPIIHLVGLLFAVYVGYHTYHFDRVKYSKNKTAFLIISWLFVWLVTMLGYIIAFLTWVFLAHYRN